MRLPLPPPELIEIGVTTSTEIGADALNRGPSDDYYDGLTYEEIEELERNREEITRNITNEMYSQRKELQHDIGQLGDDVKMMVERRFDKVYAKVYQSEEDIHREIERIYQQIPNKKRKLGNLQKEY